MLNEIETLMSLYGTLPEHTLTDGTTINAIRIRIPNPPKVAYLRLPSTPELLDFFKPAKKGKKDLSSEEKALDLFTKIRLDQGEDFDEYEAASSIDTITRSRGVSYERVGNAYQVVVETPFNMTTHTVSIPTQKQLTVFRRNAIKNYLTAVIDLYNELVTEVQGYIEEIGKDVPPQHKLDSCNQVFAALDAIDPILDPNL
jgi:hypothetical protein